MEIYKYLRNECMDIKRSVCAGGAFLCTRRRGSFQLSFFVNETMISSNRTKTRLRLCLFLSHIKGVNIKVIERRKRDYGKKENKNHRETSS